MIERLRQLREAVLEWKHQRLPLWWPYRFCMLNPTGAGIGCGVLAGALLVWLIYVPRESWLHFNWIIVTYERGVPVIHLDGEYEIVRACPEMLSAQAIWRTQAITPDGQVMSYVPGGEPPPLTVGVHQYQRTVQLDPAQDPTGWRMLFIVVCSGETPETVPSQLVTVTQRRVLAR